MQKIKITQKDFDDIYDIEEKEITEEIGASPDTSMHQEIPDKQDTTPKSVLSEAEQELDDKFLEQFPMEDLENE